MPADPGLPPRGEGRDSDWSPRRMWLIWTLYGLPRCSQSAGPYVPQVDACHRLIWPWQEREIRNGAPVHLRCIRGTPDGY